MELRLEHVSEADGGHYVGWTLHKKADGKDLKASYQLIKYKQLSNFRCISVIENVPRKTTLTCPKRSLCTLRLADLRKT